MVTPVMAMQNLEAQVTKAAWGTTRDGRSVDLYTLHNEALTITVSTYGACVVSVLAPGRNGTKANVLLGYKDVAGYEADDKTYVGSVVGRYGNRIAKGTFSLEGKTYHVPVNNGENALHGGPGGFSRQVWVAKEIAGGVEMTLVSHDGDMGFPGTLTAHVRYTLHGASLHIDFNATTDKPTVVNLTNHSYFNLAGEASGTVLAQKVKIYADRYVPTDKGSIPLGPLAPVAGTPFDFRTSTAIGARIAMEDEQLARANGYDHTFVLNGAGAGLHVAAEAVDPASGRTLTVSTTEPGVQFYSANFLAGEFTGVGGKAYAKNDGFCLETQHFPDSPNHPAFPSTELKPGHVFRSSTVFAFGIAK